MACALSVFGQSAAKTGAIERLARSVAKAYEAKNLGSLDAKHPYSGRVRVVIEHSLGEGKDQFARRDFKTLKSVDRWLKSLETGEGFPVRQIKPFQKCRNGICTYSFAGGIRHNQLYLKKLSYAYINGRLVLKTIYLLDGD